MSIAIRAIVPLLALVTLASGWCRADDTDDAIKTANDFNAAIKRGDAKEAKRLTVPSKDAGVWLDANAALALAMIHLEKVATAKYGPEGYKQLGAGDANAQSGATKFDDTTDVKIEGDAATLSPKPDPNTNEVFPPTYLKKVKGKWLMNMMKDGKMSQEQQKAIEVEKKVARILDDVCANIAAGKYPKPEDAKAAMDQKYAELAASLRQ